MSASFSQYQIEARSSTVSPSRFIAEPSRRAVATARRKLEQDLRLAVGRGELIPYYQPRLSLVTGQINSAEALLRWPHRKRGLVPPSVFIPIAEQSDLIVTLGGYVLETACRDAMSWPVWADGGGASVSVNVSARQFEGAALLRQVAQALEVSGLAPERLELELTESMLVDSSVETLLLLSAIRDLGVGLALDDFGTGYASLSMLKRLPLTAMKLDRSLVRDLPTDLEDAAICRAVVETGHALGLSMVAEGIETDAQRSFLAGIGCDEGQGWLFSPAVTLEQVRAKLAA
jgi:EAL domain-containing protein (putative c-di-GMP-specific phosphodiesterase class I)